jgi:hypothetical protein
LSEIYAAWQSHNRETIAEILRLEQENNRLFIDAYGLQDELSPDVPLEQITLTVNPKYRYGGNLSDEALENRFQSDTLAELISYAIGCMMGRYSLDQQKIDCAWLREEGKLKFKVLPNTKAGCNELIEWSLKSTSLEITQLHFIMEATGVYHEQLAIQLHNAGAMVSVVNPAQVKFYSQGLGVRTKNDKKDSAILARYGLKESPKAWQPEPVEIRTLKALIARFDGIEKDLQREKNRQEKAVIS